MASCFLNANNGAMFVQWRCDLHFEGEDAFNGKCNRVPGDPGYCSSGCTYMMGKFRTQLQYFANFVFSYGQH